MSLSPTSPWIHQEGLFFFQNGEVQVGIKMKISPDSEEIYFHFTWLNITAQQIDSISNNPKFSQPWRRLLKTLLCTEKKLVFPTIFATCPKQIQLLSYVYCVVCKCFQFGLVQILSFSNELIDISNANDQNSRQTSIYPSFFMDNV